MFYWALSFTLSNASATSVHYVIYTSWCLDCFILRDISGGTVMIYDLRLFINLVPIHCYR